MAARAGDCWGAAFAAAVLALAGLAWLRADEAAARAEADAPTPSLAASRSREPARKVVAYRSEVSIGWPVAGFRMVRAARCVRSNVPKPVRETRSPAATVSVIVTSTASRTDAAAALLCPRRAARAATNSALFMGER